MKPRWQQSKRPNPPMMSPWAAVRGMARQVVLAAAPLYCTMLIVVACNESRLVVVFDRPDAGQVNTGGTNAGHSSATGGVNTGGITRQNTGGTAGQGTGGDSEQGTGGTAGQGGDSEQGTGGNSGEGGTKTCSLDDTRCTRDDDCCSGNCAPHGDTNICSPVRGCGSRGDTCTIPSECCTDACDESTFTCVAVPACRMIGESCEWSTDCCSGACADSGHERLTCQPLSGCRPTGEICKQNSECCSQNCLVDPTTGVATCTLNAPCSPVGEICGMFPQAPYCCDSRVSGNPNVGISWCSMTLTGTPRCTSNQGTPPGASCSIPEQCSSHYCLPDAAGNLNCAEKCANNGEPCRASSDCCSGQCSDYICKDPTVRCQQIGGPCSADDRSCCSHQCGPTNTCVIPLPDHWT